MANTTLTTANKIVLNDVKLQEKVAVAGIVQPEDGFMGLSSVTIAGAGILTAQHSKNGTEHIFILANENADLSIELENGNYGLDHFIIQAEFKDKYNAGDTITIKNNNNNKEYAITGLKCYNIYNSSTKTGQLAVTGSFDKDDIDLIEVYHFNDNSAVAIINPRVAIWTT